MKKIRYFAYGSNMLTSRLERRVGKVLAVGTARLPGWGFRMNKRSADGTAKANVQRASDESVWGVLFELTPEQLDRLSYYEANYDQVEVQVEMDNGEEVPAVVYSSNRLTDTTTVDPDYIANLVKGARDHELPEEVIEELERYAEDEDCVGGPAAP